MMSDATQAAECGSSRPIVFPPGEGPAVDAPAGVLTFKARAEQTRGTLTAIESLIPPGEGPPLHVHLHEDEFIYVLAGNLCFRVEDTFHEAPAGSFILVPRGTVHTWQNVGDSPARFLFGFTPAAPGMERFFERASELEETSRGEAFARFASGAGMEMRGAPLARA